MAGNFTLPARPQTDSSWLSDAQIAYEPPQDPLPDPEVMQSSERSDPTDPQTEPDAFDGLFDEPITALVPSQSDTTKKVAVSVLPDNPTVEQLKEALKIKPPDCAGIAASYVCGNHDNVPTYSGEIIPVSAGDEIVMNSLVISVVDIDGSGNGQGLIKMPMLNVIKLGVKLEGIKVAKGGCIVAGSAETSGLVPTLTAKQLENLKLAYAAYNFTLDVGSVFAKEIADGINAAQKYIAAIKAKKEATRKILAESNVEDLAQALNNCTEIASQSRLLQDSLQAMICKVKAGKLKANLSKLEAASKANVAFMNQLGPALAACQNQPSWQEWAEKPCNGPCLGVWEVNSEFECKKELQKIFSVTEKTPIIEGLDGIFTFFEILDGCYEGWKYQTKGIVPTCLWDNMDKISPYAAGFVDRGWQIASGEDIRNVIGDFDELYCAWNKIARKTQRWLNFGACSNMSEAQAQQIQEKTKTAISFVAKYATDPAFALNTNILAAIAINNYLEEVPTSKQKQYEVGGLVFDALTIVGPIALKAANGSKMIQTITQRLKDPKVSNKLLSLLKEKGFKVQGAGKLANWVEILDIRNKINLKVGHVIENLDINSAGTKFTGCHSEISLQNHIAANPTLRYEFRNPSYDVNSGIDDASRVFEAKPVIIKADGSEMIKGNNQGVSSFFPKNWDKNKILDEVEYAIANNHGRIPEKPTGTEYFGFSKDGKVEIHFYLNTDGSIGSYFPKKR